MRTLESNTQPPEIQAGCIPLRFSKRKGIQVLIVSTSRSGKWGIPKGGIDPKDGNKDKAGLKRAARREAWEEAGVKGIMADAVTSIVRTRAPVTGEPRILYLYYMNVTKDTNNYPEKGERKKKWVSVDAAYKLIPMLRYTLVTINPLDFLREYEETNENAQSPA